MEFLTSAKKKKRARNLYMGYVLLAILVLLATYVLIASAKGYDLLSRNGDVIQNGLLFVDSKPSGADIYVNALKESNSTNAKLSLPDNSYTIVLKKPGYHDWSTGVNLLGGTVEFLTYPRLLPTITPVLQSEPIVGAAVPQTLQSKDKQSIALADQATPNQIKFIDISVIGSSVSSVTISEDSIGGKSIKSIEPLEWANDGQHLLVNVFAGDGTANYVLISKDSPEINDLSSLYKLSAAQKVGFWDGKWDRVYAFTPGAGVILANIRDKSMGAQSVVSDLVQEFYPFDGERFAYRTNVGADSVLKFYSAGKTYNIASTVDRSQTLVVKNFGYNRNDYIVVGGGGSDKTILYKNFESAIKKSREGHVAPILILPVRANTVDISRQNRFVMAADDSQISVYDIEKKSISKFAQIGDKPVRVGWFDDSRLFAYDSKAILRIFDFNGSNIYDFSASGRSIPMQNGDISTSTFVTKTPSGSLALDTVDIKNPGKQ